MSRNLPPHLQQGNCLPRPAPLSTPSPTPRAPTPLNLPRPIPNRPPPGNPPPHLRPPEPQLTTAQTQQVAQTKKRKLQSIPHEEPSLLKQKRRKLTGEYTGQVSLTTEPSTTHQLDKQGETNTTTKENTSHSSTNTPTPDTESHVERLDRVYAKISNNRSTYTPSHHFESGNWRQFFETVKEVAESPTPSPLKSDFIFEFSNDAAIHNSRIIEQANFDLETAIAQQQRFTTLTMGSELRPIEQLDKLLSHHPSYPLFR